MKYRFVLEHFHFEQTVCQSTRTVLFQSIHEFMNETITTTTTTRPNKQKNIAKGNSRVENIGNIIFSKEQAKNKQWEKIKVVAGTETNVPSH